MKDMYLLLISLPLFMLVIHIVNAQAVTVNATSFYSKDHASLLLPKGYASYIFGCSGGDFTVNNATYTSVIQAPAGACSSGVTCGSIGYQQSSNASCTLDKIDEGVLAGVALNSTITAAQLFSVSGTNKTTLNYSILQANTNTVIIGISGWYGSTTSIPANCTQYVNTYSNNSYVSISITICHQKIGNYNISLAPLASTKTPTSVAIVAYVFNASGFSQQPPITPSGSGSSGGGNPGGSSSGSSNGGSGAFKPTVTPLSGGCYQIVNLTNPDFAIVNVSGGLFNVRANFISPTGAGITIDNANSYTLSPRTPVAIGSKGGINYTVELMNISLVPAVHTITLNICPAASNTTTNTTSGSKSKQTTSTTSNTLKPKISVPVIGNTGGTTGGTVQNTTAPQTNSTGSAGTQGNAPLSTIIPISTAAVVIAIIVGIIANSRRDKDNKKGK